MQFVGLILGIALGAVLGLEIATSVVALPVLAGAVSLPASFASIPTLGLGALGAVALLIVSTVVFYVLVSFGVTALTPGGAATTDWREELGRGLLVGQNTVINFMFLAILLFPGAQILAAFVFIMNAAAVERSISTSPVYQVGLSYTALFMPMTAPLNLLGFVIGLISTAAAALGAPFAVFVEWTRAVVVTHGGVVQGVPTAWNLSNFIQAHPAMARRVPWFAPATPFSPAAGPIFVTLDGAILHEGSHTLSAAAFGWIFHIVGFIAEFVPAPNPNTYAELIAESGLRTSSRNWVDFWPPVAGAPANIPPTLTARVTVGPEIIDLGGATTVAVSRGTAIPMTAAASADTDAYPTPLGFLWRALDPSGAGLGLGTGTTATLTPGIGGTFFVDTLVTDGADGIGSAFGIVVHVTGASIAPVAPTGIDVPTLLTAAASSVGAPAAVTPTFAWSIDPASIPVGANASITPTPAGSSASFVSDTPGAFTVILVLTGSMTDAAGNPASRTDSASTTVTVV